MKAIALFTLTLFVSAPALAESISADQRCLDHGYTLGAYWEFESAAQKKIYTVCARDTDEVVAGQMKTRSGLLVSLKNDSKFVAEYRLQTAKSGDASLLVGTQISNSEKTTLELRPKDREKRLYSVKIDGASEVVTLEYGELLNNDD